jgi:DNA-binding XRE family transcriptional regulator
MVKRNSSTTDTPKKKQKTTEDLYSANQLKFLRRVGRRIAGLRVERDLSQLQLAQLAKIHRSYLASIEIGIRNAQMLTLQKLAAALKVPVKELFNVEGF